MNYACMRNMDISNGTGIGVSVFVQGCSFHCADCFNPDTWDFGGGKKWTLETREKFLEMAGTYYIKSISILGGEPLADKNLDGILDLVSEINTRYNMEQYTDADSCLINPRKSIWIYTGYEWEHIFDNHCHYHPGTREKLSTDRWKRQRIVSQCDILVDGQYLADEKDLSLKWCGSSNQRVIDIQRTLRENRIVLYTE